MTQYGISEENSDRHVMIDIETFGTTPGCVIRSIGAVFFNPKGHPEKSLGPEFYVNIREEEQLELGAVKDEKTVKWWNRWDNKKAQEQLLVDQKSFETAYNLFCMFIKGNNGKFMWGQGANFDSVLLEDLMRKAGYQVPWQFYNIRDTRTIYEAAEIDTECVQRPGTFHNALDDAKHQARLVQKSFARIALI